MIWAAFKAASWGMRIGTVVALFVSVLAIGGTIYHGIWKRGYDHALKDIAAQDDKAVGRATEYRGAFLDCRARGLRWDTGSGQCWQR